MSAPPLSHPAAFAVLQIYASSIHLALALCILRPPIPVCPICPRPTPSIYVPPDVPKSMIVANIGGSK